MSTFIERYRKKKEEEEKNKNGIVSSNKDETPVSGTKPSKKSDDSSEETTFIERVRKKKEKTTVDGWGRSAMDLATSIQDRYKTWHGNEEEEEAFTNYGNRFTELLAAANNWRNQYKDNEEVDRYISDVVSLLENTQKYAGQYHRRYSKFASENEYNDAVKVSELYSMPSSDVKPHLDKIAQEEETRNAQILALDKEKNAIKNKITRYNRGDRTAFRTLEDRKKADDQIKKIEREISQIRDGADSGIAYTTMGGQNITWQSLYDRKKAEEDFNALYSSVSSSDDFKESVEIGKGYQNPDYKTAEKGESTVNKVKYVEDNITMIALGEVNGGGSDIVHSRIFYMTNEEKNIYHYYFGRGEYDKAEEYLNSLDKKLIKRFEAKEVEAAKAIADEYPTVASVMSVFTSVLSGAEYIKDTINYASTGELDDNHLANVSTAIRSEVSSQVDWEIGGWDAFDFAYNTGMSLADSAASMALLGNAGGVALGLSAAAQGTNDALSRGMSNKDAFWTGFTSGIFEGLFESVSIGNFSALKEVSADGFKSFAKNLGKSMLVNATEETLTEIANVAYDKFMNADFSQAETSVRMYMAAGMSEAEARDKVKKETIGQIVEAGASGALMGLGMGGGGQAIGAINNRIATGQNIIDNKGYDDLRALALDVSAEASGIKSVDNAVAKADKKTSAWNVGGLSAKVESVRSSQNVADVKSALIEKGYSEKDATRTAQKIIEVAKKQNSGVEVSQAEYKAITKDNAAYEVYSSLISDPDSSVNSRNLRHENARNGIVTSEDGTEELSEAAQERVTSRVAQMVASNKIASESRFEANTGIVNETADDVAPMTAEDAAAYKGKTTYTNPETGETKVVKVQGISTIKDGEMTLKLEGGETVNASDVRFSSEGEALVYSTMLDMGVNSGVAEALVNEFKASKVDAGVYALGIKDAYEYGKGNIPLAQLSENSFARNLSDSQRQFVYKLGQTEATAQAKAKQKAINKGMAKAKGAVSTKAGKVIVEDASIAVDEKTGEIDESSLNDMQKANLAGVKALAELSPINFHIFQSSKVDGKFVGEVNGTPTSANGVYMVGTNDIWIDLNAGDMGEGTMLWTAAHEISHYIRERSPVKWKAMADFLMEEYSKKDGVSISEMLDRQKAKIMLREDAGTMTEAQIADEAYEELVSDALSDMLVDGNVANFLAEVKQKDKGLWQTIKDAIADLLKRWGEVLGVYKGRDADTAEAQALRGMENAYKKLQKMYAEAFAEANKVEEAQAYLMENGIDVVVDGNQEAASLNSVRNLLDNDQKQKVAKALADRFDVTEAEAMEWLKAETSLASLILNPKYSQYLDYEADASEDAIKKNSDYPQGTVDFSNICKKRRAFTEVINRVLRNFPDHIFMATDLAKIRTIMEQEKMEVACAICYVEDRRQLDSIVAKDFIDSLELYRNGSKTRPDGKAFNANQLKALSLIDGDSYVPSIYELVSLEGRNELKAKNPAMEEAWVKFNNARGMQSVRLLTNEAEYDRQILKYNEKTVQSKNNLGGLRLYSFSDAEMFHLIDIIQVITDSATVGLMLQGYTKVNEYAKAVKDTGEKLNRSLIPKGELGYHIEDGKVILDFDTVEGIDINHPDFFDNSDNPNVGNIVIGINNRQIRAAMVSEFIDQIIPFHTGQSAEVLGEKGIATWDNYKDFQSEKDIATGKKSGHQINIYTEVIQAAEKEGKPITNKVDFVNRFLEVCKENGLEPRFSQFLNTNENGDYVYTEGYHKFLVDFKTFDQKTGEYLPQMPVKPIFDDAYITGLLKDYAKSQKQKDADLAKSMPRVIDRITNEVVKPAEKLDAKFSLRGKTADGIEVYETSKAVLNMPWKKRKALYLSFIKKDYVGRTAKFVRNGHVYYAEFDRKNAKKAIYGDIRSDDPGRAALINTGADGSVFELIENSTYDRSGKDRKKHSSTDYFDYFIKTVQIDGKVFDLLADVKKQYYKDGGFVYTIHLVENEKIKASPIQRGQALLNNSGNALIDGNSIPQKSNSVKSKNSERNITEIESHQYQAMVSHFGMTRNFDVAGYMLGNGAMLDFSGKHWGDDYSTSRQVDHRDIQEVLPDKNNGVDSMINMIGNGNIRLMPETGGINLAVMPNDTQINRLKEYIRHFKGEVIVDVDAVGGDTIHSFTYNKGTNPAAVIRDIKAYFEDGTIPQAQPEYRQFLYSDRVTDKETLDFLENQEHVTVYRAMQLIDGKLYPPMNAYTYDENGKKVLMPHSEIGTWEQSVERPDLIDPKTGKFKLDKGKVDSGKRGTPIPAAYNPYIHTSLSMLNDQFTSAYTRSNLVTVKGVVPKSELTSGYKAQYAKDAVGETAWHSGVVSTQLPESRKVILSRWFKPVEILGEDVVAKSIKDMLGDTGIEIPYNVVSPKLRRSLENIGVPVGEGRGLKGLPPKDEVKYSERNSNGEVLSEGQQEYFKDSKVRDADGNLRVVYHGTPNGTFTEFKMTDGTISSLMSQYGAGFYFDTDKKSAARYTATVNKTSGATNRKVYEVYLNITNPLEITDTSHVVTKEQLAAVIKRGNYEWFFTNGMPHELRNWLGKSKSEIQQMSRDEVINHWVDMVYERASFDSDILSSMVKAFKGESVVSAMREVFGKDGIRVNDSYGEMWIAWDTNQVKQTDNLNPTSNPDIRYSERNTDSNRSLLANALETTVQNEVEANKLAQYKAKIDLIDAEQRKLAEINAEIRELSFSKGERDTERLKALRFDAAQTANRINTYDRQLLNLESTKVLKRVLEREKGLARKRQKQQNAEALKQYREKFEVEKQKIREKNAESRKKAAEGRQKTEMRHKIKKVVSELNQLLLNGSKDNHVMIGLQKAVASALDAVNLDTVGAAERVAKYDALIAKATDPDVIASLTESRNRIQEMGDKMSGKLTALKNAYDDIKNSTDPLIANSHDEVITSRIEYIIEKVGDTSLRDMTLEQLEDVYDMYTMVLTTIRNSNKAFKADKAVSIATLGNNAMAEVEEAGGSKTHVLGGKIGAAVSAVKNFDFNNLKPVYFFERVGSKILSRLFENVRKGEDTWAVNITEAKDFKEKTADKYGYSKWDFDKVYTFESTTGKKYTMSLEQIMSLYAYSKREQALPHLQQGGFVFDQSIETYKEEDGKKSRLKYRVNTATAYKVSEAEVAKIIGNLTTDQKSFVDEMQDYLSTVMGEKGNEVSLAMYGIKLFKEKHYFPLKSAKQYMFEQNEVAGEVKIKNASFSKATVKFANNPVILSNFMDVWANHVNDMSMYHAFVLPLEDFNRVFNYRTPASEDIDSESVKGYIQNAYGSQANQYISQLLKDLNGGARVDPRESIGRGLVGKFKKASTFASLSVIVQQPSAVGRALAEVDAKYFDFNPKLINHSKHWAEVKKYAPVAIIKEMGHFDTDMGRSSVDYIKGDMTILNKADDFLSKPAAYMDELTWVHIWTAVKREVMAKNKGITGEELLRKSGERFTEVVTKTQVYDSVLSRSANMRSKSMFMNMVTSFLAEPTTSINMIEDAISNFKRGNKRKGGRQIASVASSVVLNSLLVSLVYAARDDDEDETYLEKYLGSLTSELIDGLNPITYYPYLKDVWSIMQGYDVERSDMSVISKAVGSLTNVISVMSKDTEGMSDEELEEHNQTIVDAWLGIAGDFSSLFGVPAKNIIRDIKAGFNVYNTANRGHESSLSLIWDKVAESAKDTLPDLGWFTTEKKTDKLYDAIINGDTAYISRLKSGYKDEKAYNNAVTKALRENDPRIRKAAEARLSGDMTLYKEIALEIKGEGHFSQDIIVRAINSEMNALDKGDSTSSGVSEKPMYTNADFYKAAIGGDSADVNAVKEYLIESGKTESTIESSFNSSVKDAYEQGEIDSMKAVSLMVEFGGKTSEEASISVKYVDFKAEYPDYADSITEAKFAKYFEPIENYGNYSLDDMGISLSTYANYCEKTASITGVDNDGDGKTDSGSKKALVMQVIDDLPLTSSQKDALYYLNGWSARTIYEAPWH